jgi:hypothetical protein
MQVTKKSKTTMQRPDFTVSKANQEKAGQIFQNFFSGTKRQLEKDKESFSSFAMIKRMLSKDKTDPSDNHILEVIKRFEKDKLHSQVAIQFSETAQKQAQNMQKLVLIKMIPFIVSLIGILVFATLTLMQRPLSVTSFETLRFLIPCLLLVPVLIWGSMQRAAAKFDMLSLNILLQASSAYASAKMQGKGAVAAMQNLSEMRRKAKAMDDKSKNSKKDKKK